MRAASHDANVPPPLSLRVLDLTDEKGQFCGKILADLGADVVVVEPPGGSQTRHLGPFFQDVSHPERSLFWLAYNANKRGITLNVETDDGREILRKLVHTADCVVESFPPGYLASLGLGYADLTEINPLIIMTSISHFGQAGPYRDYKATDIVGMAMGGMMHITGDPDRPPVVIGFPQAYLQASADAAVATLMAYYFREANGVGQHVDVSMQQSVTLCAHQAAPHWLLDRSIVSRQGIYRSALTSGGSKSRAIWPCRDGYVAFVVHGATVGARTNRALADWMESEALATDAIRQLSTDDFDMAKATTTVMEEIDRAIESFFLKHTKAELYAGAVERGLMLQPVNSVEDLLRDNQLESRAFWTRVEHPELGTTITYPGPFVKASELNCGIRSRAPLIGEHNQAIYAEIGLSPQDLSRLAQAGII